MNKVYFIYRYYAKHKISINAIFIYLLISCFVNKECFYCEIRRRYVIRIHYFYIFVNLFLL